MGLAEEIARVRMKARGAEINARHRRGKEKASRLAAAMGPPAPIDGVHPDFAKKLDAARARAKEQAERSQPRSPTERIDELVRQGKLPPRPGDLGVGYEPTPEELLGELAEAAPPDGTEDLPDAASVLSSDPPKGSAEWGEPPAPAAPVAAASAPGLARSAPAVQHKRKRGK